MLRNEMTAQVYRKKMRRSVVDLYQHHDGNKSRLAAALGVTRQTLHRWIREDPDLARALADVDRKRFEKMLQSAKR